MMFKRLATTSLAMLALGFSQAFAASPAQELFNQATYYIAFYYGGYASVDWQNFSSTYQPELDTACAEQPNCPYSAAVPIIKKMIESLADGHSSYLSADEVKEFRRAQTGEEAPLRVGMYTMPIKDSSDRLVVDVIEDAPAARAGLKRGDRLVGLNGQPSSTFGDEFGMAINKAVSSGQPVTLNAQRGPKKLDFKLRGEVIVSVRLPSFKAINKTTAVIRIPTFEFRGVGQTVHDLVNRAQRGNIKTLIVDVRDNPGGLATEFLIASGAFVGNLSYVLQTRAASLSTIWKAPNVFAGDASGQPSLMLQTVYQPAVWKGKAIVLVNSNSYSGAEYFAQALQDAKRAQVIGEPSGGLGNTVTTPYELQDGSAMTITLGKALHLNGDPLPERVTPDLEIKEDLDVLASTGRDLIFEKALALAVK